MRTKLTFLLSAVLLLAGLGFAQTDPGTENLKHSWTFEDGTTDDHVGGVNGTLVGEALVTDGVLWLSQLGDWMELDGEAIAIYDYDEITLEAWYIPLADGNPGWTMLVYLGDIVSDMGADGYFISVARQDDISRTAISCLEYSAPYGNESGANGPEYNDGELHHIVSTLTYDSISISIDGVLSERNALDNINNEIGNLSPNYAYIGRGGYNGDDSWLGDIEEVNIYDRALTDDEVLFLFEKGPTEGGGSAVEETAARPADFRLLQNYPNPFNPNTSISFDLPAQSEVRIAVYDVLGKELTRLVDGVMPAGRHTVQFDGKDLSSGLYLCRMDTKDQSYITRMMLLK